MSNLNQRLPHTERLPHTDSDRQKPTHPPMPDFYMPAMPPLGLITAVENGIRTLVRRWRFRRRFLSLLDYDDHILEDMGHDREEILWASRLPLRVDATQAILERREQRRKALRQ
ncbi:hypothetical protein GCM10007160_35600 [Litchfieldella qijiaojingensis]|uniref:DUF1127 domain-containing protein n=1 Tax=Litchfieldella qijiaojingensis TaxID=980347 RepID=A0ABQ2Z8K2_9GAMM|nr:hypothetical protein [Halomonas qijiaojingensis]GGY04815.1 hypothetical protein GCM10007160_35600 [Halomonas qijiaojingensis]